MLQLHRIHHIAIICSDYEKSKHFYTQILGLQIIQEHFRADRNSYKLDLAVNGVYSIELFSFTEPPIRKSNPEACGLRHLAFEVNDIHQTKQHLENCGVQTENLRIDLWTQKHFFFIADPDTLPIEFYER